MNNNVNLTIASIWTIRVFNHRLYQHWIKHSNLKNKFKRFADVVGNNHRMVALRQVRQYG
jgi:hypothetical protein